jgi:hypothetical protein
LVAEVCNQTGKGTGDWEVAFGNRVIHRKALILLAKIRRKGFRRALIERENCVYEVSVIHLSHARANAIAARAPEKGSQRPGRPELTAAPSRQAITS